MTTFRLTIAGLSRNQVFDVLEKLPRGVAAVLSMDEDVVRVSGPDTLRKTRREKKKRVAKKKPIATPTDIMSLTGKKASSGSKRETVLQILESLEHEHGVGSVTRAQLREALQKQKIDVQILYQLMHENFIDSYAGGER